MALIEEAVAKAEQYIAEGTELPAKNADEDNREDKRDENMIRHEAQVPTTQNVQNLRQRSNQRLD